METKYDINDTILLSVKVSAIEINKYSTKYTLELPYGEISQKAKGYFITIMDDDRIMSKCVSGGKAIKEE